MPQPFATLLRQTRLCRQFTQETLAERAGLSTRTIGDLERGRGRAPRPTTTELLATALSLDGHERTAFVDAGRSQFWFRRRPSRAA
jgi:transcriptional regulator with XRE-family HTH domain